MMSIEKHRTLARELVGEALMTQADTIQREDAMFEDPQATYGDLTRGGHDTGRSRFHASRPGKGARSRTD